MSVLAVSALFVVETAAHIYTRGLEVASALGLPVTTWRTGDPTRSLYKYLAEILASREDVTSEYIKAGFLSSASGEWLKVLALDVYGVEVAEASHATATVEVENTGGGFYVRVSRDMTFKNSSTGKTYHSTNDVTIASGPGTTATFEVEADEAGSDSNAGVDEIDEIVTTLLGVEITTSTAAVAVDEPSDEAIKEQCRATRGALSPNGPADAYEYVARNAELTGVIDVTRARSIDDDAEGNVVVYVASAAGAVATESVDAVQVAIEQWATPLTITPTVVNASGVAFDVEADVTAEDIPAGADDAIEAALGDLFAAVDIGGTLAQSAIIAAIHNTLVGLGATDVVVELTLPASTTVLDEGQVPILGDVTISGL